MQLKKKKKTDLKNWITVKMSYKSFTFELSVTHRVMEFQIVVLGKKKDIVFWIEKNA